MEQVYDSVAGLGFEPYLKSMMAGWESSLDFLIPEFHLSLPVYEETNPTTQGIIHWVMTKISCIFNILISEAR